MFSNWIVGDKEGGNIIRYQWWHEHNHTWYKTRVPKRCGVSREVKYLISIPWYGAVWCWAYIYRSIYETLPLVWCLLGTSYRWWMVFCIEFLFTEVSLWSIATLSPAKWWKYKGLGLNFWWWQQSERQVTLVGDKEIYKFNGKGNPRRWWRWKKAIFLGEKNTCLKIWKRNTMQTRILVNEWYCIYNVKFLF